MFMIVKEFCFDANAYLWKVCRRDGKSFNDGVISYNFVLDDWEEAIRCRKALEQINS